MRERTTWDRNEIAKNASTKKAEDPRAMNQDHLQQQPSADAYVTGGPSEFAEDVHPAAGTWKAEYSGGEVSRNEIGMPAMRGDTFNHPERTASMTDEEILKKANLCTDVARRMLSKKASEQAIEEQSLALMTMPNALLIETANRLAAQDEEEGQDQGQQGQDQGQQAKQAKDAQQEEKKEGQDDKEGQGQQGQADQGKEAGQIPPQFKEQIEKKKEEAAEKKDDDGKKEAGSSFMRALKAGDGQGIEAALQAMIANAFQQMSQGQQQAPMAQQQQQAPVAQGQQQQAPMAQQQQAPMAQQQQAPVAQGQQQQAPMSQGQQQMADDQLLDQMLQEGLGQPGQQQVPMAQGQDIQLEPNSMDIGEVQLGEADEVLTALFASNTEYQNAAEAHQIQTGQPVTASVPQPMVRTAASRTIGTRPTVGVSQIGGAPAGAAPSTGEVDKLSGLWQSAPDVSNVFR